MATVGAGGFLNPAFESTAVVAGSELIMPRIFGQTIVGSLTEIAFGPFYIGGRGAGIGIHFKSNDNRGRLGCLFAAEEISNVLALNEITRHDVIINGLGSFDGIVQASGQNLYVKVQVGGGGTAQLNFDLTMWMSPSIGLPLLRERSNILFAVDGTAVGIGANVVTETLRTWPGAAMWYETQANAGAYNAELASRNLDGSFTRFCTFVNPGGIQHAVPVFLPANPIRHLHANTSAGATTFQAFLVAQYDLYS